jgi:hypothetical protein
MRECECEYATVDLGGIMIMDPKLPVRVLYVNSGITVKSSTGLQGMYVRHKIGSNLWQSNWAGGGAATARMVRPGPLDEAAYSCGSACLPGVPAALAVHASCVAREHVGGRLG